MVGAAGVMLVDQVEGVPSEEDCFIESFGLAVGSKSLVVQCADIELDSGFEALLLHPWATIASESDLVVTDLLEFVHDFGAGEVTLTGVGEDANRLLVSGRESASRYLHIFN